MKLSHSARLIGVTGVLALLSVGLLAAPAAADPLPLDTATINWDDSNYDGFTGEIEEAEPFYLAQEIQGWTDDAFDGYGLLTLDVGGQDWEFRADSTSQTGLGSGTIVDTMTGDSADAFDGRRFEVTLVRTLKGNFAQWAYAIKPVVPNPTPVPSATPSVDPVRAVELAGVSPVLSLDDVALSFSGNLGSDGDTEVVSGANWVVTNDGRIDPEFPEDAYHSDPVIGHFATTDAAGTFSGWRAEEGDDDVVASAVGASSFTITTAIAEYVLGADDTVDACDGFEAARAFMIGIAPTLDAKMGESFDPFGTCMTFAPVALTTGIAVDQVLTYAVNADLGDGFQNDDSAYFGPGSTATIANLPAGLTATAVKSTSDDTIVFTLKGIPTTAGSFAPRVEFSNVLVSEPDRAFSASGASQLIVASVPIVVTDPIAPKIAISLNFTAGSSLSSASSAISGEGLLAGSPFTLTMHSEPVILASGLATASGTFSETISLPANAPAGAHELILEGTGADGKPLKSSAWFSILRNGTIGNVSSNGPVTYVEPTATPTPTPTVTPSANPTTAPAGADAQSGDKLASTGFDGATGGIAAGILVLLGASFAFIAIRRRTA